MKKLFALLALSGLVFVSCSKDVAEGDSGKKDQVKVTFNAGLPSGAIKTYASNDGAVGNVTFGANAGEFNVRYIMEVYDGTMLVNRTVQSETDPTTGTSISVNLVPKSYRFVFWADIVPNTDPTADYHYNTTSLSATLPTGDVDYGLSAVTINSTDFTANDDTRDAYTVYADVNLTASTLQNITLTRPFGKVRIVATDVYPGLIPTPALANLQYVSQIPSGFNAFSAEPLAVATAATYTTPQEFYNDLSGTTQTLAWDYIFAGSQNNSYDFSVMVFAADGTTEVTTNTLTSIPVQRNKLTTVTGNFLSASATFVVIISPNFDEDILVQNVNSIQAYLNTYDENLNAISLALTGKINNAFGVIDIPAYDPAKVPFVAFTLSGGIASTGDIGFVSTAGYTGEVRFILSNNITGNVSIDLPTATTVIEGPLASYKPNLSITNASSVTWAVGTFADLRAALMSDGNQTGVNVPYNKGVMLTADILDCNQDPNIWEQAIPVGDYTEPVDHNMLAGYVFDGNGHKLAGSAWSLLKVFANNTVIKDLTISNAMTTPQTGTGLALYGASNVQLINVTAENCKAAGIMLNGSSATMDNITTSGNGWGGISITKGGDPSLSLPQLISLTNGNILDTNPIWADFSGINSIDPTTLFNDPNWTVDTTSVPGYYFWANI